MYTDTDGNFGCSDCDVEKLENKEQQLQSLLLEWVRHGHLCRRCDELADKTADLLGCNDTNADESPPATLPWLEPFYRP